MKKSLISGLVMLALCGVTVPSAMAHGKVSDVIDASAAVIVEFTARERHDNGKVEKFDSIYVGKVTPIRGHFHHEWPILRPANSFTRNIENGETVRLTLMKSDKTDAYYAVAIDSDSDVSIDVQPILVQ